MRLHPLLLAAGLAGCAVNDSHVAQAARSRLVGLPEAQLESCLGVPNRQQSYGRTNVLTYDTASAASSSFSLPLVGGPSFSNGGNCHATYTVTDGRVSSVIYSGEKNATAAPDAYCAPIVRSCLERLGKPGAPAAAGASQKLAQGLP